LSEGTDTMTDTIAAQGPRDGAGLTPYTRFVAFLARVLVSSVGRVRIENHMAAPPQGPLIIVANHISIMDPPLVGGWLAPLLGRRP
jgi:1-acyl-sn-glycerol-3-phosphate acyltransferase